MTDKFCVYIEKVDNGFIIWQGSLDYAVKPYRTGVAMTKLDAEKVARRFLNAYLKEQTYD